MIMKCHRPSQDAPSNSLKRGQVAFFGYKWFCGHPGKIYGVRTSEIPFPAHMENGMWHLNARLG